MTEIGGYMLGDVGGDGTNDDNFRFIMRNCKVPASKQFVKESLASFGHYFEASNCSDQSAEAEYQLHIEKCTGRVEDTGPDNVSGGIYRVESTAFDGANQTSFKVTTSAKASLGTPFVFDLTDIFADLTAAGSDQITAYLATTSSDLDTANTWLEVAYPDATNKQTWETVSTRASNILSGSALTSDGGDSDWEDNGTDLAGYNEYEITATTSTGAACIPRVRLFCGVPSITLYVGTSLGLS